MWLLLACADPGKTLPDDTTTTTTVEADPSPLAGTLTWTKILGEDERVDDPRDLGFDADGYLWVANREDDRTFVVFDPGTPEQSHQRREDAQSSHFMEETSALSFDGNVQFGSCGESRNTYNDQYRANDFMGPVLWSTDLTVFGEMDPSGLGSHLDMLHESPLCVGIAWEHDNVYWVNDGDHERIVRYDFNQDHGIGQDDHSDGIVFRYSEPTVTRVAEAPGHMVYDHDADLLYVADTGGGRVLWLDTTTGTQGDDLAQRMEPLDTYAEWNDVEWGEVVTDLDQPGGLAMTAEGTLIVGEWGTGMLREYALDGTELRTIDTGFGPEALYGVEIGPDGLVWVTETATPGVWHVEKAAE